MHFHKKWPCVFACLVTISVNAQESPAQQKAIVLKRMIELNHFNPRAVDDSFSSEMFGKCINELDPHRDIFMASEFTALAAYRYKLDDELKGSGWAFLDLMTQYYRQGLKRADSIVNAVLQKPLDFTAADNITYNQERRDFNFATTAAELGNRWRRRFKYYLLTDVYEKGSSDSVRLPLKDLLPKYEYAIRQKLKKVESANIEHLLDPADYENNVKEIYLNALATCFDPHTMYFSPQEKENFQAAVSSEQYSLGFTIDDTNDGKIIIDHLIPGGPAWKSGELNRDDQMVQVQWQGKEAVDVSSLTAEELDKILDEANHGEITIKVRKADGIVKTVILHKEKIETADDRVKGFVLQGKNKLGYISLPGFYTTWEDENGSGCANDVAKEIIKLKRENIEGLILDLRYNGGGSVNEALQMIGIFIDEGPLAGVKDRSQKLSFLKDPNRGTIYDGPLLLLVNSQSASASEMLAAALQDYNRAVVAGSTTYGKATMQRMFSLDTLSNNAMPVINGDVVKITEGKLYRVTGQTAQLSGVTPDIALPDIFDGLKYREKFSSDALPADTVKKNTYYKPLSPLPVSELLQQSQGRVASNPYFANIKIAIQVEAEILKNNTLVLKPDAFEKWVQQTERLKSMVETHDKYHTEIFTAENYAADQQRIQADTYVKEMDEVVLKNLQQDAYIEEAFNVVCDLIKITNHQ